MPDFTHFIKDLHPGDLLDSVFDEFESRGYKLEDVKEGVKTVNDSEIVKLDSSIQLDNQGAFRIPRLEVSVSNFHFMQDATKYLSD